MVNISRTLRKSTFLVRQPIFRPVHNGLGRAILRFLHERPLHPGPKHFQKWWEHENFLESCKETSKLSGDVFWGRWDHIVAQKSDIKFFSSKNP